MSHCSPLSEAAAAAVEVENMEETAVSAELERTFGENPTASNSERYAASMNAEDDQDEGASYNAKLRTCYFLEGEARALGAKTVPEPNGDEAVMYEDFFISGLCMLPHLALADILLHFQA
jgi:hypothetical protein